jgi:hypothetical protein
MVLLSEAVLRWTRTDVVCNRLVAEDFAKDVKEKAEALGQEAKSKGTADPHKEHFNPMFILRNCD